MQDCSSQETVEVLTLSAESSTHNNESVWQIKLRQTHRASNISTINIHLTTYIYTF